MQWVCDICGYVHEEDEPPEICPVCGAPQSKFSEADQDWDEDAPQKKDAIEEIVDDIEIEETPVDDEETNADELFDDDDFDEFGDDDEDR